MVKYVMVMDYLKLIIGIEIMRPLSVPIIRGSDVVVTAAMVPMRGRSTSAAAVVMPAPIAGSVLCFRSLERKRLTLLKVVMNKGE